MHPVRAIACAIALALLLPAVTASNHGGGGTPSPGNDCNTRRDATAANPIHLSNGVRCNAELPNGDEEDWFTFTANDWDEVEFSGGSSQMDMTFCVYRPSGIPRGCSNWGYGFESDESGTWKILAEPIARYGGDDYSLTVSVYANPPPMAVSVACAPNPVAIGAAAECQLRGADDDWITWTVDWADGTTSYTGYVAPGIHTVLHSWPAASTHTIRATPTDAQGATGNTVTSTIRVQANTAPRVEALACTPPKPAPGTVVTCTFRVMDDSDGVQATLDWGDGGTTRVPTAGTVRPGGILTATRAYAAPGRFTVQATAADNGGLSSAPATAVVPVLLNRADAGWILLGQPGTRMGQSLDDPEDRERRIGWDSVWIPLVGQVHSVQLDWYATVPSDANINFYKEDGRERATGATDLRCARVTISVVEACDTPPEARWAMVTATLGADIEFTLTQWHS